MSTVPDSRQLDRAEGVLLGLAAGDALGAGYEFGPPLDVETPVGMVGGGVFDWAPGEWTDDTSMAIAIADVAAEGLDLRGVEAQDRIAERWIEWAATAPDVGAQTRQVLADAQHQSPGAGSQSLSVRMRWSAFELHQRTGRTAGNGSLMRTAPVALAYLHDPENLVAAAHAVSNLTHADPEAGEACVLWCLGIREAVLHGSFDGVYDGLRHLPRDRRRVWDERLRAAQQRPPASFTNNGWVVEAFQGAWSAITHTPQAPQPPQLANPTAQQGATVGRQDEQGEVDHEVDDDRAEEGHLVGALLGAVRGGGDTDTVAAIAGGLLGARWGAAAVPASWQAVLHGWPGATAPDLRALAVRIVRAHQVTRHGDDASHDRGERSAVQEWAALLGRRAKLVVSDPWELVDRDGRNQFAVTVCDVEGLTSETSDPRPAMLLRTDQRLEWRGRSYAYFVARPRREGEGWPAALLTGATLSCDAVGISDPGARGDPPWGADRWRGGLGLRSALTLDDRGQPR